MSDVIPLDRTIKSPSDCNCEFTPYDAPDGPEGSWHYLRECQQCKTTWYSLHCPHDGYQNKCPNCNARANQVEEAMTAAHREAR